MQTQHKLIDAVSGAVGTTEASPFDCAAADAYRSWRAARLAQAPRSPADVTVSIADPARVSSAEAAAVLAALSRSNMVFYRITDRGLCDDETRMRPALATWLASLGLVSVEPHRSAEADGFVAIEVTDSPRKKGFIPYTNRPLSWHTDGYYNQPSAAIRSMLLHCVRAAGEGGNNTFLDPEIAYIRVRDANPAWIRALMHPQAMTIPAAVEEDGIERPASTGPVFWTDPTDGRLVMRYTARTRSIGWRDTDETRAASEFLRHLLAEGDDPLVIETRLAPGEGVLCNNVLHARTAFAEQTASPRRLLRARFTRRADSHSNGHDRKP